MKEWDGAAPEDIGRFDESLLAARAGLQDQIGVLLEQCRPALLAIAEAELPTELRGKIGASDIVQESLTCAIIDFAEFRGTSHEELAAWLRRILLNRLSNVRKAYHTGKRSVRRELPGASDLPDELQLSPSQELSRTEDAEALTAAVSRLPEDYRQIIQLRHRERKSFAEIGQMLERSEDAVGKLWARALQSLSRELNRG